jgi:sialic acid synthase SpsE
MLIAEIGLNHLGLKKNLSNYLLGLKKSNIKAVTIQIREEKFYNVQKKFFLKDNIYKFFFFEAKKNFKVGVALSDYNKIMFIDKCNVDFIKVLSKDFMNQKLVKSISKLNKPTYLSIGNFSTQEVKKYIKIYKKFNKDLRIIYTCFENDKYKLDLKKITFFKKLLKLPVSYGNHHINKQKIISSSRYNPESIFFYVKGNNNHVYPDDKYAIKLSKIKNFFKIK